MAGNKACIVGKEYRLRAGQPQAQKGCPSNQTSKFILQTFGGELRETINYKATDELLASTDMVGLNAAGEFESANYQGTQYVGKNGDFLFTGQEVKIVQYISEDEVPGIKGFGI